MILSLDRNLTIPNKRFKFKSKQRDILKSTYNFSDKIKSRKGHRFIRTGN